MARPVVCLLALLCCQVFGEEEPLESLTGPSPVSDDVVGTFFDPRMGRGAEFQHLAFDELTDTLYAAGTNSLYQLDGKTFKVEMKSSTGPQLDSPFCNEKGDCIQPGVAQMRPAVVAERKNPADMPSTDYQSDSNSVELTGGKLPNTTGPRSLVNNHNQILLVFQPKRILIVCGTVFQGICHSYALGNVSQPLSMAQPVAVAANSPNGTTVAFVSKGSEAETPVLYVGSTFTFDAFRENFPAVATRSLQERNFLRLNDPGDISGQSAMVVQTDFRSDFRISYVGGFYSEGFAYWATVQKTNPTDHTAPWVTKLIRVCGRDDRYNTYAEVPLECIGEDNSKFNLLQSITVGRVGRNILATLPTEWKAQQHADMEFLIATFAKGTNPLKPEAKSAVCLYPLKDIRSVFQFNIERCNNGIGYLNLPHYGYTRRCQKMYDSVPEDFCVEAMVGGEIPVSKAPLIEYSRDVLLTAVTMDVVGPHTVLFLGTSSGDVKKVLLKSKSEAKEFATLSVAPGLPIRPDMTLDRSHENLFVMAKNKVLKVKTSSCERHTDCSTCVQSEDPYCGWCLLENRCSQQSSCGESEDEKRWIPMGTGQCPKIVQMIPNNASNLAPMDTVVRISFNFLPKLKANHIYRCAFDKSFVDAEFEAPATLKCNLPPVNSRTKMPDGQDHISVPLKIWSLESGSVFYEDRFVFFDCGRHRLCTSCVSSRWQCDWCLQESSCVFDSAVCQNQVVIYSENHLVGTVSQEMLSSSSCPHILSEKDPIVLPSGYEKGPLKLTVVNLDKMGGIPTSQIECSMSVEDKTATVNGRLLSDGGTVECNSFPFSYDSAKPTVTGTLQISVNGGYTLDRLRVEMYKCDLLADDCSRCLTLDSKYQCRWCGGRCQYDKSCPKGSPGDSSDPVCPAPVIESFSPSTGPKEGGTRVTIVGRDLGVRRSEVENRIFVAGVPCALVVYETSKRIECITGPANKDVINAPVSVIVRKSTGSQQAVSAELFRYVSPQIFSFKPSLGPKSGGTKLQIEGSHLNSAASSKIFLGNLPCEVEKNSTTDSRLLCITTRAPRAGYSTPGVTLVMDKANRSLPNSFVYTEDPVVQVVEPLESFKSGGRLMTVRGVFFDSIQLPSIYFLSLYTGERLTNPMPCTVVNGSFMYCPSPPYIGRIAKEVKTVRFTREADVESDERSPRHYVVPQKTVEIAYEEKPDLSQYEHVGIGFTMDNVQSVRNLSGRFKVALTPDPEYFPFEEQNKILRGEDLILKGRNLNLATTKADVKVWVGQESCQVSVVTPTQLVCAPPLKKPRGVNYRGEKTSSGEPAVTVQLGNLNFTLGHLVYDTPLAPISQSVLAGVIAAALGILLVGIILLAVWWRRKSFQAEKEYKRIQMQMDTLESNVRNECKQAFAELQTDMSDLTSDLITIGIPYHSRRTFASKILFREDNSMMLEWPNSSPSAYPPHFHEALLQYESLLRNKSFVMVLVDTFERQSTFAAQDKVYVASLLTAALARNMQYCTDVVLQLLVNLIEKSVDSKCPHMMLRRTESVVEKMLANWMALCLYDYLQESAGESLFLLFKALKHQVEKGPVDAVTGDARYSLSEDRLLKEQIQPESVLVHIIAPSELEPEEKLCCRVLNCDTISQAKAKILDTLYRHTPNSTRPSIHDVELEWRHSPSGHVLLQDDDKTSPQGKDGWRRMNTLGHYGVTGQAIMAIGPKNRQVFTYNSDHYNCSNQTYASIASSTLLFRHSPDNVELGVRYWHLVKPDDHRGGGPHGNGIPEIYLTRLLATKGTVQKFIDDFFSAALSINRQFPPVVKFIFDFLEDQASRNGVVDPTVVHAWKNNSLPLRFWVNIIKNPDFIFDAEKSGTVDSCLSAIAQTFMDSCSTTESRLGKDSPSNKLLFARDMPRYRDLVTQFYADIRHLPSVSEQELGAHMAQLSKSYAQEFNVFGAVRELLTYTVKYSEEVVEALNSDPTARRCGLANKLISILNLTSQPRV